jgi:uncharacterized protein (TIGR03083 family)
MGEWNAMTYEGKDTMLRVVRREAERMFAMVEEPGAFNAATACTGWSARDVVGHLVDTTEGYFDSFDAARSSQQRELSNLPAMLETANKGAIRFRDLTQQELMDRIRIDFDKMMGILEPLTKEEWEGFIVEHYYMGPVPAFFYAAGQLMDYAVHGWDIMEGRGQHHVLDADSADLLVPFMLLVWKYTIRPDADLTPYEIGLRISGNSGGDYRVSMSEAGMEYGLGDIDGLTRIEYDPGSLVLAAYNRTHAGAVRGDPALAHRFLNSFFAI